MLGLDGMVDWFFVLSAFLLTLPYARALHDGRPLTSARDFRGRRAVRIVPLYVVAVLVVAVPRTLGRTATWALRTVGAGGFVITAVALVERGSGSRDWVFHVLCGLAFAAVGLAGAIGRPAGPWHRISAAGVLPWLGLVSYSLSLWHEPLLLHLSGNGLLPTPAPDALAPTVAVVVPLAVLAAWVSYWLVEYPTSHLRVFLSDVPSRELALERRGAL